MMFLNLPTEQITLDSIEQLLNTGVAEGPSLEFKEDFPKHLEKSISSMANTYGGLILIGVKQTVTGTGIVPVEGIRLQPGLRERVIQIGINAIYPPIVPDVRVVDFKSDAMLAAPDRALLVISVHESEEAHAVDGRTAVYIRADNISDRIKKATIEEIEWFQQKREKSRREKTRILENAQRHAREFLTRLRTKHRLSTSYPKGRFVFWAVPTFPRSPLATPKDLYERSKKLIVPVSEIGVSTFPTGMPHRVHEGIYWAGESGGELYYTEIQQQGLIYSEFGFWWDDDATAPTQIFFPSAAAELIWAGSKFALGMYHDVGYLGLFDFHFHVVGVRDRALEGRPLYQPQMLDDVIELPHVTLSAMSDEADLFKPARSILRELYWALGIDATDTRLDKDFGKK